jgi:hypothetical protein
MSANSAVTVLRSPSIVWLPAVSDATRICEAGGSAEPGSLSPREIPHFLQNRAPWLTGVWQLGHLASNLAPHCSQNAASLEFSLLQLEQSISLLAHFSEQIGGQ